jgi:Holliday junction resolvasome RuvABC endonuclease subunit
VLVFGIDPGYAQVGVALVDYGRSSTRVVYSETLRTTTKLTADDRIDFFVDRFCELVERYEPAVIGYENQAGVVTGIARRAREEGEHTGMSAAARRVLEVCGAIRATARFYALPCYVLAPSTIKVALLGKGAGHAPKERMREGARRIFHVEGSEHVADAVAVTIATVRRHRMELASVRRAGALIR